MPFARPYRSITQKHALLLRHLYTVNHQHRVTAKCLLSRRLQSLRYYMEACQGVSGVCCRTTDFHSVRRRLMHKRREGGLVRAIRNEKYAWFFEFLDNMRECIHSNQYNRRWAIMACFCVVTMFPCTSIDMYKLLSYEQYVPTTFIVVV